MNPDLDSLTSPMKQLQRSLCNVLKDEFCAKFLQGVGSCEVPVYTPKFLQGFGLCLYRKQVGLRIFFDNDYHSQMSISSHKYGSGNQHIVC